MHPFISQKTSDQCEVLYVTLSVSINMNYFEIQGTQCVYLKMHAQYVSFISQREQFFFFFSNLILLLFLSLHVISDLQFTTNNQLSECGIWHSFCLCPNYL